MSAAHVVLFAALTLAAWTDLRRRMIPNVITYPAIAMVFAISAGSSQWEGFAASLLGAAVCGGLLALAWLAGALGGGDVKLAVLMGASLGWTEGLHALMWTFTLAAVCMLSTVIWKEGLGGIWRSLRPRPLPGDIAGTMTPDARPMYLAPAALAAVLLVTWPK
ncbi:Type IV leader peptidase family protein [Caulifigura coniformis]|uniref:Type IV leader peptidase family protein n=1 Tax=Caulifigura coniformis TaxID=2527983 RepID=A0A517SEY0_9PLAN|nr:A24 family peptidase [Caulifigura coniformis]QDT54695.1 Type IV leader peptidase family protein [Caulifigura coniformis]